MTQDKRHLRLLWPREVAADQLTSAMRLLAVSGGTPLVLQAFGHHGRVEHRLHLAEGHTSHVVTQLRRAIPGVGLESAAPLDLPLTAAVQVRLSTRRRPLRIDQPLMTSQALLSALAHVGRGEALLLQWVLATSTPARVVPSKIDSLPSESTWKALLSAPFGLAPPADNDTRSALRAKHAEPGWRASIQVAANAATPSRSRQLIRGVLHALRLSEAPGVRLTAHSIPVSHVIQQKGRRRTLLNTAELSTVCAWPLGSTADLPVSRLGSRRLPPPPKITNEARSLGLSTWPGQQRPITLGVDDAQRHLHVVGPTGVGKSTLMLNLIEQDMRAGRSVVVIEPKGDLIRDVLQRVPNNRQDDVVLIDPTDTDAVVGINPLSTALGEQDLAADQLLATFHGLYAAHWGPRTSDILHASLLTLARTPGTSLVALPLLLGDASFRRRLVGRLNDPVGLGPFWTQFEAWSEAERTTAIAPVMNKLRPFLMRPSLRRVVGQPAPRFRLRSIFTERKIVLVNVAKGQLGPEAASLLGALVLSGIWQTAQERTAVPHSRRHPVMVFIDEFQNYLHLPTDLGDALTQARGLGLGFTLAHQHLTQLEPGIRAAVMANARSKVCFQLGSDDARIFAGTSPILGSEDFASLDAFHFYAQLLQGGAVTPWCSGASLPASKPNDERAAKVRASSRSQYATPVTEIDQQIEALVSGTKRTRTVSTDDLQPKRRPGGRP